MKIKLSKSQWEHIGRTAGWGGFTEKDTKGKLDTKGELGQNQLLSMPKFPVATDKPWGKPIANSEQMGNIKKNPKKA